MQRRRTMISARNRPCRYRNYGQFSNKRGQRPGRKFGLGGWRGLRKRRPAKEYRRPRLIHAPGLPARLIGLSRASALTGSSGYVTHAGWPGRCRAGAATGELGVGDELVEPVSAAGAISRRQLERRAYGRKTKMQPGADFGFDVWRVQRASRGQQPRGEGVITCLRTLSWPARLGLSHSSTVPNEPAFAAAGSLRAAAGQVRYRPMACSGGALRPYRDIPGRSETRAGGKVHTWEAAAGQNVTASRVAFTHPVRSPDEGSRRQGDRARRAQSRARA